MKYLLIICPLFLIQGCTSWQGKELWINDYINITRPVSKHLAPQDRYEWAVENGLHHNYNHKLAHNEGELNRIWGNMHRVGASNFYMGNGGVEPWQTKRVWDPASRTFRPYLNEAEYLNK